MLTSPITTKPTATSRPANSESICIRRHGPGWRLLSWCFIRCNDPTCSCQDPVRASFFRSFAILPFLAKLESSLVTAFLFHLSWVYLAYKLATFPPPNVQVSGADCDALVVSPISPEGKRYEGTLIVITGLMLALWSFTEGQPSVAPRFFKIPEKTAVRVRTKNGITS